MKRWSVVVMFLLGLSTSALVAQEGEEGAAGDAVAGKPVCLEDKEVLKIKLCGPEGWERVESPGNEKSLGSFRDKKSQSQIEVIGTPLINADVADVFFETFHNTLQESEFKQEVEPKAVKIALKAGEVDGKQAEYSFQHTGIVLRVVVFSFVKENRAFIVVGYFKEDERNVYYENLLKTLKTASFT